MEGGSRDVEASWRVNGQLAVDEVLIPFTLQHYGMERVNDYRASKHNLMPQLWCQGIEFVVRMLFFSNKHPVMKTRSP